MLQAQDGPDCQVARGDQLRHQRAQLPPGLENLSQPVISQGNEIMVVLCIFNQNKCSKGVELDTYNLAKSYFDLKEYDRAAFFIKNSTSSLCQY